MVDTNRRWITLLTIAVVVLLAVSAALLVLQMRDEPEPVAAPTPTPTPEVAETTAPAPDEDAEQAPGAPGQEPESTAAALEFAGYTWNVRDYEGAPTTVGGWSIEHVWVEAGEMHLYLGLADGEWAGAEVYTQEEGFGYGTYSWTIDTPLDTLHPNVVFGMFTYDAEAQGNREIDIEIARWGLPYPLSNNLYYAYWGGQGDEVFILEDLHWRMDGRTPTRHSFRWEPGRITWEAQDMNGTVLQRLVEVSNTVFEPGNERVHMNIWISGDLPPDGPTEIVVSDFTFTPGV